MIVDSIGPFVLQRRSCYTKYLLEMIWHAYFVVTDDLIMILFSVKFEIEMTLLDFYWVLFIESIFLLLLDYSH